MKSFPQTFRLRRGCVYGAILVVFLALAARLTYIEAFQQRTWTALAERMETESVVIEADRGIILDREGHALAATTHVPSLYINPRAVPAEEREEAAAALARILNLDADRLVDTLSRPKYGIRLKRNLSEAEVEAVQQAGIPGIWLPSEPRRRYPDGDMLRAVLGTVGTDGNGMAGIEAQFESALAGTPGRASVLKDGLGRALYAARPSGVWDAVDLDDPQGGMISPAVNGQSLVLTIDTPIQRIVEEELAAACAKYRPESGCAVVLDPWTGDVLAMACWPAGRFAQNMAVSEMLEPGSSFKPFVCSAALEAGVVTPETVFDCHDGVYRIGSRTLHDAHGYGRLSVRDIIAFSSNIGMAQVGERLGAARMHAKLSAFGFGRRTGIELPGESAGMLHPLKQWGKLSLSSIPMGQEIAVSPLQLTAGYCVFANGGWWVRPRIVLGMADGDGRRMLTPARQPVFHRALSEPIARLMCGDILAGVVERGTARECAIPGYRMSGKTGTAQLARPGGHGYEPGAYTSVFVGIVPTDAPRFVISVILKKPEAAHYGGVVSAPAVARMAERLLSMYHAPRAAVAREAAPVVMKTSHESGGNHRFNEMGPGPRE